MTTDWAPAQLPLDMESRRIFTLGGIKVGVTSLALAGTPHMSQSGDLVFQPELETLRAETRALREAGAEFLVCVAHTDRTMDNEIVRSRLVDGNKRFML